MTIVEKIQYAADKKVITFFKEGLFYKCYNEDAMVFTQKVRAYKVQVRYVKSVGSEVLSLGFPISEIEKENLKLQSISQAIGAESNKEMPHGIVFTLTEDIKQNYPKYYEEIKKSKSIVAEKQLKYDTTPKDIFLKIQEFDLANSTPMQGMVFIQELKNQIKLQG